MITIYGSHTPMFLKPVLAAEELGLPYKVEFVDLMKGEHKTPEHLARHPFGKVPAMEHQGEVLFESNAICRYLGDLAESPLYPKERLARAKVDQWLDFYSLQLGRLITNVWFQRCIAKKYFDQEPDEKQISEWSEMILDGLPVVDGILAKLRFVAGDSFTLADVNAFVLCGHAAEAGLELGDFRNFNRWIDEVRERPATKKVYAAWG